MARWFDTLSTLYLWPWTATRFAADLAETMLDAPKVIGMRAPMIGEAMANPLTADHRELARMITEKLDAFGRSHHATGAAQLHVWRASQANVRALSRLGGGDLFGFAEWMQIGERNLDIFATLAAWPAAALAPIHSGVASNMRRLEIAR